VTRWKKKAVTPTFLKELKPSSKNKPVNKQRYVKPFVAVVIALGAGSLRFVHYACKHLN